MTINRFKKTISVILIVSLISCNFISFADNIDVNVSGGDGVGYNINGDGGELAILGDLEIKGARVSLWDVEKQELVERIDMVDFTKKSYEEVSKFRRLSGLTKPEIMKLNEKLTDKMQGNVDDYITKDTGYIDSKNFNITYESYKANYNEKKALLDIETDEEKKNDIANEVENLRKVLESLENEKDKYKYEPYYDEMGKYLCSESIEFPEIYMKGVNTSHIDEERAEEFVKEKENKRIEGIKNFYKNEENTYRLISQFSNEESTIEKFKEGKICILLEPLLCFYNKIYLPDSYWMMTCAEIGLLAINGYDYIKGSDYNNNKGVSDDINKTIVAVKRLGSWAYLALPYGTFKENDGLIKVIKAYENNGKAVMILRENGYRDMINMMGCLEIIATKATESEIKIEFSPTPSEVVKENNIVSDDFSLYEDELSYVFDYKSIHKSDDTRYISFYELVTTANILT